MEQELFHLYNDFYASIEKLRDSNGDYKETLEKKDVIEKFLFSFDIFVKIIKTLLKRHNVNYDFSDKCIKAAVKFGYLASEEIYLKMLDDNYKIMQLNGKRYPEDMFLRIQVKYIPLLTNFLVKVRENYLTNLKI